MAQIIPYLLIPAIIQFRLCQKAGKKARRRPLIITPILALVSIALYPFLPYTTFIANFFRFFFNYYSRGWVVIDDDLIIITLYSSLFFVGFCIGWIIHRIYVAVKPTNNHK